MIQKNNNLSVLPFYTDIGQQWHRKSYAYGKVYPLFTPANTILPFQIIRPTRPEGIFEVRLYKKDGSDYEYITRQMRETGIQIKRFPDLGYDIILYPGVLPMALNMLSGEYYLQIFDSRDIFTSEVFTIIPDISCFLKIEWYDVEDLLFDGGRIIYKDPSFKNVLYLDSELGKPEYKFEEEGEQRDGFFFPEKQISEKIYKTLTLAPEWLCDVMRLIRLSDYVTVTDKYGIVYDCDTFLISPKWQNQGYLASVEIEFETNTVVKKIGRGYDKWTGKGDFNDDHNNDFYKKSPFEPWNNK